MVRRGFESGYVLSQCYRRELCPPLITRCQADRVGQVVNHSKNCDNRRQAVGVICQYVSSKRLRGRSDAEISAKLRGLEMKAGPEFSLVFAKGAFYLSL